MAAPARTGTASEANASGGNGSTTVTVPADCNLAVAFWTHWDNNGGSSLSALTLNGAGFTIQSQLAEGAATDETGVGVATLVNPTTGSQTLAWTWSAGGARAEGGKIIVVWVTGGNTSDPVRAAGTNATTSANDLSVAVSSATDDLVLGVCDSFSTTNPAISGTVFINNAVLNSHAHDAAEQTAGAGTTTVTMTGEDYSSMAAISLKAAAAGGTSILRQMMAHH